MIVEKRLKYRADITAGSLKVAESRIIADLLLKRVDNTAWTSAIDDDNVLQARSRATARRLSRLIRGRLETMPPEIWGLVRDGSASVASHACLAAAVKHSDLLADFLRLVVCEQYKIFAHSLNYQLWEDFVSECQGRDSSTQTWSDSTIRRLRSSVFQILAQAGYIQDTKTLRLQKLHISDEVVKSLDLHGEGDVLRCIQVNQ